MFSSWHRSWSRDSPELHRTRKWVFTSFKRRCHGNQRRARSTPRTITVSDHALADPPVPVWSRWAALPPTFLFFPESAKRPDSYRNARSAESTLVIDDAVLASLPTDSEIPALVQIPADGPAVVTGQTPAPAQRTQPIRAPIQTKDREFDDMREELQDIKRQLAEQNVERNAQKQNGPSKQKTPVIP